MGGKEKISKAELQARIEELEQKLAAANAVSAALAGPAVPVDSELLSNLPGMSYRCRNNERWDLESVSAGCLELTGYSQAELLAGVVTIGKDLILEEYRQPVWEQVQDALRTRSHYKLGYALQTRWGDVKWIWEQGAGVYDAAGELLALEGLMLDASDLHLTQRALRIRNAQLHAMNRVTRSLTQVEHISELNSALSTLKEDFAQFSSVALLLYDVEGDALYVEHEVGHDAVNNPKANWLPAAHGIIGRCARTGMPQVINDTSADPDFFEVVPGSTRSEAAFPLLSSEGLLGVLNFDSPQTNTFDEELAAALSAIAQAVVVVIERIKLLGSLRSELAQRREAEQARDSVEQLLSTVVEDSPLGITVRAPDGKLIRANEAWLNFWGVDEERRQVLENLAPSEFEESVLEFFGQEHGNPILDVYRVGGYYAVDELEIEHPQSGHRWMSFKCYSLQDENGEVNRVVSITEDISERRLAEQGRDAAEKLMASAFQHSHIGLTVRSKNGRLLFYNESWREIWGVDDAELEEQLALNMQGSLEMLTRTFGAETAEQVSRLFTSGGSLKVNSVRWERYGNPADVRWLDVLFFTVQDDSGLVSNLVTITSDATDKRLGEVRLQQSEMQLRQIIDLVPHFIFAKDLEGRFILGNQALAEAYGCSVADLIGRRDSDFDPNPEEVEHFIQDDREVIRTQQPMVIPEEVITDASGRQRYLQTTKIPFHTLADDAPAVLGVAIDITERKQALEALQQSEERWSFALEGAGDGVWDWDIPSGRVLFSRQLAGMLGYELEEFGDNLEAWTSRLHPEDAQRTQQEVLDYFQGKTAGYSSEHRLLCRDGSYKWVLDRGKIVSRNADGSPRRMIGTHTDISFMKAAQRELEDLAGWHEQAEEIGLIGSWDWDVESGRIRWSKQYYILMGYEPFSIEPTLGFFDQHIHPDDLAMLKGTQAESLASRSATTEIHRIITGKGEVKWVQHFAKEVIEPGGHLRFRGITQDISKLKNSEESLRELNRILKLIGTQAQHLASIESWQELEDSLGRRMVELLGLSNLCIMLVDEDDNVLRPVFNYGLYRDETAEGFFIPVGQGIMGQCAAQVQATVVNDTSLHPGFFELKPGTIRSEAAFPLVSGNRLIGVLNFDSPQRGFFTPDLVEGLAAIAQQVTVVIERMRLLDSLRDELAQRRRQEQILSNSEQRLRTVIDTAADAIIVMDEQGLIESFNHSAEHIFGYREEEALGREIDVLLDGGDALTPVSWFSRYLDSPQSRGAEQSLEVTGRRQDGRAVPLELIVTEMNLGGERRFLAMMRDISFRIEARRALAESEQRYRALVSNLPNSVIILYDRDARFVLLDGPEISAAGFDREQLIGRKARDVVPPDYYPIIETNVERVFAGESFTTELLVGPLYFEIAHVPLYGSDGEVEYSLVLMQNISARKDAETALRESEMRFSALMEYASDIVTVLDINGVIKYESPAITRILGYTAEELLGTFAFELLHPDDRERVGAVFAGGMAQDGVIGSAEYRARHKDGHYVHLESIGSNRLHVPGLEGMVISSRDIGERKRAEEERRRLEAQIQHAQKLESLGVLAGGIAHDFNNLLVGIMGNAGLALLDLPPESSARRPLQQIETGAVRAAELTRQMLAYSGKGKFVVQPINLSRAVEEMAHLLNTVISKKAVLRFDFAPGLPAVEADATQVRQVVMNLITNASDAIGERSGAITIRTGLMYADSAYLHSTLISDGVEPGNFAFVEVVDSGIGMDEATLKRIFDPFFSTKFTGRGLGLAAVLGIIRGHKGTIKVYSEPGKGTSFKVLFPSADPALASPEPDRSAAPAWHGEGTILVVDDDESVRAVSRGILLRAGFEVLLANDGVEGLEICRERGAALTCVLADLTMPHMGGEELFRQLRVEGFRMPVVLMSGYSEQDVTSQFQGKGLASFVQKPFGPSDLIRSVRTAVEGRQGAKPAATDESPDSAVSSDPDAGV